MNPLDEIKAVHALSAYNPMKVLFVKQLMSNKKLQTDSKYYKDLIEYITEPSVSVILLQIQSNNFVIHSFYQLEQILILGEQLNDFYADLCKVKLGDFSEFVSNAFQTIGDKNEFWENYYLLMEHLRYVEITQFDGTQKKMCYQIYCFVLRYVQGVAKILNLEGINASGYLINFEDSVQIQLTILQGVLEGISPIPRIINYVIDKHYSVEIQLLEQYFSLNRLLEPLDFFRKWLKYPNTIFAYSAEDIEVAKKWIESYFLRFNSSSMAIFCTNGIIDRENAMLAAHSKFEEVDAFVCETIRVLDKYKVLTADLKQAIHFNLKYHKELTLG